MHSIDQKWLLMLQKISVSNAVLLNFLFIKEVWKKKYSFHKDIEHHNCFQDW